jgi:hypothetical protein
MPASPIWGLSQPLHWASVRYGAFFHLEIHIQTAPPKLSVLITPLSNSLVPSSDTLCHLITCDLGFPQGIPDSSLKPPRHSGSPKLSSFGGWCSSLRPTRVLDNTQSEAGVYDDLPMFLCYIDESF